MNVLLRHSELYLMFLALNSNVVTNLVKTVSVLNFIMYSHWRMIITNCFHLINSFNQFMHIYIKECGWFQFMHQLAFSRNDSTCNHILIFHIYDMLSVFCKANITLEKVPICTVFSILSYMDMINGNVLITKVSKAWLVQRKENDAVTLDQTIFADLCLYDKVYETGAG